MLLFFLLYQLCKDTKLQKSFSLVLPRLVNGCLFTSKAIKSNLRFTHRFAFALFSVATFVYSPMALLILLNILLFFDLLSLSKDLIFKFFNLPICKFVIRAFIVSLVWGFGVIFCCFIVIVVMVWGVLNVALGDGFIFCILAVLNRSKHFLFKKYSSSSISFYREIFGDFNHSMKNCSGFYSCIKVAFAMLYLLSSYVWKIFGFRFFEFCGWY